MIDKSKEEFIKEISLLQKRIAEPETADTGRERTEEALQPACNELEQRVAERTEALEKQYAQLNELKSIISRSDLLVFVWRIEPGKWPVEFVSDNVENILGYSIDDFISGRVLWPSITHQDDVPRLEKEVAGYLEQGVKRWSQEYHLVTKSGEVIWCRDNKFAFADSAGRITRIQAVIHNVTERKQTEDALKMSIDLLLEMITQVPGVVYQFYARPNGEMGFYYVSGTSEKILGLKPDLDGYFERFTALVIPEHREGFIKSIKKAVSESAEWKYEGMMQKPSGEKIWFSEHSTPSWRENEIVFNGIVQDITERKKADEELRVKEIAIASSINAIAIFSLDGNLTYINDSFLQLWGYDNGEEVIGKSFSMFWEEEAEAHTVTDALQQSGRWIGEMNAKKKDGSIVPVQLSGNIISNSSSNAVGMMTTAIDISKRREAEEALKESERRLKELVDKTIRSQEELKASYSELKASKDDLVRSEKLAYTGRIAASIAHEIRNPLTNISMSIRQLKKGGRIKPEGHTHSDIIERNAERVNFLITELLNCARPAKLNPAPYDIHRVIKDALIFGKSKIRSQKVKVIKRFSAKPSILKIDKEHMGRVLLNLITNAVDAMPDGGNLTISTEINKCLFLIKVQDTGKGIPEKDIIKIFDPFFSTKPQGIGLGLTTCYGIIVSHGGTIEVESKRRKGTTFIISLPIEHTQRSGGEGVAGKVYGKYKVGY